MVATLPACAATARFARLLMVGNFKAAPDASKRGATRQESKMTTALPTCRIVSDCLETESDPIRHGLRTRVESSRMPHTSMRGLRFFFLGKRWPEIFIGTACLRSLRYI